MSGKGGYTDRGGDRGAVALAVGGMAALLVGRKIVALGMFARGFAKLEAAWRREHPEFRGTMADRWNEAITFYESTHRNSTNRTLHVVGIPMIVGGGAGLLLFRPFRPLWFASATSFAVGWGLNILGHAAYEKNAPAFAADPLSFVAGPVWDFKQIFAKKRQVSIEA